MTIRLGILVAICAIGYAAYLYAFPSVTYRYRITLVAEIDGREAVGSGVVQITEARRLGWMSNSGGYRHTILGEAFGVELGSRGKLFALLKGGNRPCSMPFRVVRDSFAVPPIADDHKRFAHMRGLRGKRDLNFDCLPLLIRFGDMSDPLTVQKVDPTDLSASFGPSARLLRAEIEITRAPLSSGIEKEIPWLKDYQGLNLARSNIHDSFFPSGITSFHFQRHR